MNKEEHKIILNKIDKSKKTLKSRIEKGYCIRVQEKKIAELEAMLNDTKPSVKHCWLSDENTVPAYVSDMTLGVNNPFVSNRLKEYIKHNCRREEGPEFTNPDGTEYFQPESIKAARVHESFGMVNANAIPLYTEKDLDTYKVSNILDMSELLSDLGVSPADIAAKWTQKAPRDYHKMLEGKGTDELINMIASLDRVTYYLGSYKQGDISSELFFLKIDHHNIKEENKRLKNEIDLLKQSSNPETNFYQDKIKELEYKLKIYESEKDDDINTLSLRLAAAQSEIEHLKGQLNSSEVVVSKEKVLPEINELYIRYESVLNQLGECNIENAFLKELLKIFDNDLLDDRSILNIIRPLLKTLHPLFTFKVNFS